MKPRPKSISRLARPQTLLSQTERVLREAIRRGEFDGQRMPAAADLAEQLGVSRETVRLAQESLQREGLLVKYRRKGTLLQPPALTLKKRSARTTVLAYLQADYPSVGGGDEAVTRAVSGLMLQGATREAGRAGYQLAVRHAPHTEMDQAIEELCSGGRVAGVIFASFGEDKQVRQTLGHGLPTVLLDHELNLPGVSTVREDSFQGARIAVEYLASLGHRRIAYANWHLQDLNPWRLKGYREGLRLARVPRRRSWELSCEITNPGAAGLAGALASLNPRPSALLCFNNSLARLLIEKLRRHRLRVPEDVSVMGGGGEEAAGLTFCQANWFEMGRCAAQVLLRALSRRGEGEPEHRLFPYEVHPGRTAARPAE